MTQATVPPLMTPVAPHAGRALAIAALAIAILGLCIPLVGLVAVVLGILAFVRGHGAWRGLGAGGAALGAVSLVVSLLALGVLLPALAKARETARLVKSGRQLDVIAKAMAVYQRQWNGMPPDGTDIETLIVSANYTARETWLSPYSDPDSLTPSYLFVTLDPSTLDPNALFICENPDLGSRRVTVVNGDLSIRSVDRAEAIELLRNEPTLYTSRGERWRPSSLTR
ncbi:MAG: hypothetical protein JNM94_01690 [Phycisphaerae bacterium]|nr:hypothetical protein [Phycisphaerae bacterium]